MKKRPVNLGKSAENIADQYPDIFVGLQKDAGQNSWDARLTKRGKDWRLLFKYKKITDIQKLGADAKKKLGITNLPEDAYDCLIIEDFGTTGMDEEKWLKYQGLWTTAKGEGNELGARGQGKFLFHYFATDGIVLTETIDESGKYRFSVGNSESYDDEHYTLMDFLPNEKSLNHQGTRIWIMDIKKELYDELLNYKTFMDSITSTWWEIIRNWNAAFIVDFDGTDRQVSLPELPKAKKEKKLESEKIGHFGKVRSLVMVYSEDEVPEKWRGIAVQRGGMTILRMLPVTDENLKRRIYGYCNFDEYLELELKKCELPNHFGFTNKRAWNHVREYIRKKLDEFIYEISPKKEKVSVDKNLLDEAVRIINNLVEEHAPELLAGPTGPGPKPPPPPLPPPPPPPEVRIDIFRPNARKLEYNETLITECAVVNETDDEKDLQLDIRIGHKDGRVKYSSKYNIILNGQIRKKVDMPLIDFDEKTDKAGKYVAEAILKDLKNGGELHRKRFTFYLHEEPPPPPGKVFIKEYMLINGKGLPFEKLKNLPINDKGTLRVIYDHPEFVFRREQAKGKKQLKREILLYCTNCGISEVMRKLLELRYYENKLELDEIKRIKNTCDEMAYDAVLETGT